MRWEFGICRRLVPSDRRNLLPVPCRGSRSRVVWQVFVSHLLVWGESSLASAGRVPRYERLYRHFQRNSTRFGIKSAPVKISAFPKTYDRINWRASFVSSARVQAKSVRFNDCLLRGGQL